MKRKKRRLGQHFLVDGEACSRIVECVRIKPGDHVLEIGPGKGALTRLLAEKTERLTLIEPDKKLLPGLKRSYPTADIIAERAEMVDLSALEGPVVVVSNLPYYVSVHIYKHCIENIRNVSRMVLTFQKEVAQRVSAQPGTKSYGSLSVLSRYYWDIEKVLTIPPPAFKPPPKVESMALKFAPRPSPPVAADPEKLFTLVRASFVHKRRTLRNNLKGVYTEGSIETAFNRTELPEKIRAEAVSLERFGEMAELLIDC